MNKGKAILGIGVFLLALASSAPGQQTILIRNGRIALSSDRSSKKAVF